MMHALQEVHLPWYMLSVDHALLLVHRSPAGGTALCESTHRSHLHQPANVTNQSID
jgi:hypothetical protein